MINFEGKTSGEITWSINTDKKELNFQVDEMGQQNYFLREKMSRFHNSRKI